MPNNTLIDEVRAFYEAEMVIAQEDGCPSIELLMASFAAEQLRLQREQIAADLKQIAGEELEGYIKQLQERK